MEAATVTATDNDSLGRGQWRCTPPVRQSLVDNGGVVMTAVTAKSGGVTAMAGEGRMSIG